MTDWTDEYKRKMRAFMEEKGVPVAVEKRGYDWEKDDDVSPYGWTDYDALRHCKGVDSGYQGDGCAWVVPEGARLYERTYNQFDGTFTDNKNQVGINVAGCRCACGKYTDTFLRFDGTLDEVIRQITGAPGRAEIIL
jgi:hypothetical protein